MKLSKNLRKLRNAYLHKASPATEGIPCWVTNEQGKRAISKADYIRVWKVCQQHREEELAISTKVRWSYCPYSRVGTVYTAKKEYQYSGYSRRAFLEKIAKW